jgi:hypothetical protein
MKTRKIRPSGFFLFWGKVVIPDAIRRDTPDYGSGAPGNQNSALGDIIIQRNRQN